MPESLSASGNSAKESRAAAEATKSEQTEDTVDEEAPAAEDTAATEPETSSSGAATAGGSWSFTLDESTPKEMVLTLFQSGDAVFGTGSINTGDSTLVVAASGTADSDSMDLDVTSIGTISLYRMALNLDGDSASGSYDAFAASGDTWTGNAHGVRSVSQ
jgi:ATPase subunit of ABC transporter with duplicated ATPase domains